MWSVAAATALRRDGARIDDDVYVSGDLGLSRYAYESVGQTDQAACPELLKAATQKLHWPQPRAALGQALLRWHMRAWIFRMVCTFDAYMSGPQVGIVLDATAIPVALFQTMCGLQPNVWPWPCIRVTSMNCAGQPLLR